MEESYLHYIWKAKRFKGHRLSLIDGREVQIKNVGWHNHDAGPDFFNGTILIDGIEWTGNIELHVRSSDWYLHNHQVDEAYKNVILHVVYEYNKPVEVDNRELPTIELSQFIDLEHYSRYQEKVLNNSSKPCSAHLVGLKDELTQQIQLSFFQRIERKGIDLLNHADQLILDEYEVFVSALAQAFGGRLNRIPMQELMNGLSLKIIWKEQWSRERIEAMVFGKAGFLEESSCAYQSKLAKIWSLLQRKYSLKSMRKSSWKFKGVRPSSYPTRKLAELACVLQRINRKTTKFLDAEEIEGVINELLNFEINSFWKSHVHFNRVSNFNQSLKLTKNAKDLITVNAIGPFLVYRKHKFGEHNNDLIVLDLLEAIPAERNKVIDEWKKLNVPVKSAIDSQGLLELNNEFCTFRKCLSCQVGNAILNS
jgi:hypothetical protein